jgi:D-arabinose 1-dehydrogenase-like Zn-dependent alcohol dehydrogenase
MLAVVVARYGGMLELMDRPVPHPDAGEVLVRVRASGLCSTDLHLLSGRMLLGDLPRILGHESAGEIVEEVVRLTGSGKPKPVIGAHYPLEQIGATVERLERGELVGRIVLTRE